MVGQDLGEAMADVQWTLDDSDGDQGNGTDPYLILYRMVPPPTHPPTHPYLPPPPPPPPRLRTVCNRLQPFTTVRSRCSRLSPLAAVRIRL